MARKRHRTAAQIAAVKRRKRDKNGKFATRSGTNKSKTVFRAKGRGGSAKVVNTKRKNSRETAVSATVKIGGRSYNVGIVGRRDKRGRQSWHTWSSRKRR